MLETLHPFILSLLIGFIIGIEREHNQQHPTQVLGVRTFTLIALLGTLAAWHQEIIFAVVITLFVFAIILLSYIRSTSKDQSKIDIGITTELAAGVVFCLGYLTFHEEILACIIASIVLLILIGRKQLHHFSKKQLKPQEIRAAATILILAAGIIPLLPNQPIDPWQLFNPQRFALLILLIALLQFGGYIAIRVFGERMGILLMGFFGGFISSTAVFANLSHFSRREPKLKKIACAAGILATVGSLFEVAVILLIAAAPLFYAVLWPLITMIIVGTILALLLLSSSPINKLAEIHKSPLNIKAVIYLATIIALMIIIVAIAQLFFGSSATIIVAFLGGLFELHGITLATATLFFENHLHLSEAGLTIITAVFASFVTKFFILSFIARNRFALLTSFLLAIMLGSGLILAYTL